MPLWWRRGERRSLKTKSIFTTASPTEYRRGLGPSSVLVCVYDICLPFVTRPSFLPTALTRPLGIPTAEQARGMAPLMPFQHQQWAAGTEPPLWVWSVVWEHFVGYWFLATEDCVLKDVWHIWSHVWVPKVDGQGLMIINDQWCLVRRCCVGSLPPPKRTDAQVKVVKNDGLEVFIPLTIVKHELIWEFIRVYNALGSHLYLTHVLQLSQPLPPHLPPSFIFSAAYLFLINHCFQLGLPLCTWV